MRFKSFTFPYQCVWTVQFSLRSKDFLDKIIVLLNSVFKFLEDQQYLTFNVARLDSLSFTLQAKKLCGRADQNNLLSAITVPFYFLWALHPNRKLLELWGPFVSGNCQMLPRSDLHWAVSGQSIFKEFPQWSLSWNQTVRKVAAPHPSPLCPICKQPLN